LGRLLALVVALIAAAVIAWAGERTPSPAPASAPAASFSADRAMVDIKAFASVPHPIGSAADHAARDYLLARMTALGLQPQVHQGVGLQQSKRAPGRISGGFVDNLVGVLPGRDRGLPAVALMAHYDSVPASPGSADDAAGVATALEAVRAVETRGVPDRDVVVLLTDGEEAGLLGANAFFRRDPMAKSIGFVLNMEARGAAGRVQMFQTAEENGQAIALLTRTVSRPSASSLTGFVYKHMPNDTDFTESMKAGVPGLNYAFIGHQFDYHSPSSIPATMDPGTLQDMGDQVLPTAMALAFSPRLPERAPDVVYSQIPGGITLAYPTVFGWLILAVSAGLLAWSIVRARRLEAFPWLHLARGAGAGLFAVLTAGAVMHFARRATGADFGFLEQRFLLAQAARWETALLLLGVGVLLFAAAELARGRRLGALLPLAAGVASCAFGFDRVGLILGFAAAVVGALAYGRATSRPAGWAGVLLLGLVLAVAAQIAAPTAAFILAWPLALAIVAAFATTLAVQRGPAALVVLAVLGAVGLGFAGSFAHSSYLSLDLPELLMLSVLAAAFSAWPLAQTEEGAPPARLLGPVLILAGLAVTLAVRVNHPYDARHPQATDVVYRLNQNLQRAWRVSTTPDLPAWSQAVLQTGGAHIEKIRTDPGRPPVDAAPAPYIALPGPDMTLAKAADGELRLHVTPPPGARTINLEFSSNTLGAIDSVAGVKAYLPLRPGAPAAIHWAAAPQGFDVTIHPAGPGKLTVRYDAVTEQWPAAAPPLPKRPADVMPFDISDSTVVAGERQFSW
jgi:hypothetical protein